MTSPTPGDRAKADRVYALLLHAYPTAFRARFEISMRDTFAHEHAAARARGSRAALLFWPAVVLDTGWSGARARATALARAFRTARTSLLQTLAFDVRDAARALGAAPVVSLMAVLSVALGVGANTALFSIVNSLVLKVLPVRAPEQLLLIDHGDWTNPIWEQIRAHQDDIFNGAFAYSSMRFDLSTSGQSDWIDGAYVSGRMFDVLGVPAIRGRVLADADDVPGGGPNGPAVVVSYDFWQQRFGASDDIVGRHLTLSHVPFTIVGVMPRGFFGPEVGRSPQAFIPIGAEQMIQGPESALDDRMDRWLQIIIRTKPDQTLDAATAALRAIQPDVRAATLPVGFPAAQLAHYLADPFSLRQAAGGARSVLRTRFAQPLTVMLSVVGIVLVIACANIANLFLARASSRRHELGVRLALGASRARLARQLLTESALLAGTGGVLGLGLAQAGSRLLVRQLTTSTTDVFLDLTIDWRVFAFTATITLLTALLFGLGPALAATRVAPADAIKEQPEQRRGVTGDRPLGARTLLVVAQVALSLVLLVAAGLFIRTFSAVLAAPLGLNADPIVLVHAHAANVSPSDRPAVFDRLQQAAAGVPGVRSAAISAIGLLSGLGWSTRVDVHGGAETDGLRPPSVNAVTPGWFSTYGMRVVSGRDFTTGDRAGAPDVVIVNEAFGRMYFKDQNPIGRQILGNVSGVRTPPARRLLNIVGVVSDAAYRSIREGIVPTIYIPLAQTTIPGLWVAPTLSVAATTAPSAQLTRDLAQALGQVDTRVTFTFRPLAGEVHGVIAQERLVAVLSGFFGGLALLLAAIGLYGVTSYAVSRRRAEIAVRIALGADPRDVARLMLGRVAGLIGVGVGVGAAMAYWAARFVSASLLFGIGARDARTFIVAAIVLAAVGAFAGWLPARRAGRIDSNQVLQERWKETSSLRTSGRIRRVHRGAV